jgi:pilus assembly protein FimV
MGGAGEGNRTLVCSLGSCRSTIELHPHLIYVKPSHVYCLHSTIHHWNRALHWSKVIAVHYPPAYRAGHNNIAREGIMIGKFQNKYLRQLIVVSILALTPCLAAAVGMGQINVLSALGQPLHVEIELIAVQKQDIGSMNARLGSSGAYEQSNLQLGAAGSAGIRVSVERRANGTSYVLVTSGQRVNEPFVNLLIELTSQSGQITRAYSVLLDPPEMAPPKPAAVTAPPAAIATAAPPTPVPAAQAAAPAGEYGPVQRGETLSRIAGRVRPQGATLQQTMMGIFRANPPAFINNNINLLRAGHRLRIPDAAQMSTLAQDEANREVQNQTTAWNAARLPPAESPTPPVAPKPAESSAPPATAARGAEARKDVVKLSRGEPGPGKGRSTEDRLRMLEEELIAREKALNDANERIKKLEKAVMQAAPAAVPAPAKK